MGTMPPRRPSLAAFPRRALVALVAGLALAGCPAGTTPKPQTSTTPVKPKATTAVTEPSPTPQKLLKFEAVVKAPAGGGTGAATPWNAASGVEVSLLLASTRRPLADVAAVKTDAAGKAAFSIKPPGAPILIQAKVGAVTLRRVYPVEDGDQAVVDPSTTLVAVYFDRLEVGKNDAMKRIDAPRLGALAVKVRGKLEADAAGVDLATDDTITAAYEAMMAADPQLESQTYAALGRSALGSKPSPAP